MKILCKWLALSGFTVMLLSACGPGRKVTRKADTEPTESHYEIRWIQADTLLDKSSLRSRLNASEPHIAINRARPSNIVAGSILNNVYFTADTGRHWQHGRLTSPLGVYGDPVLMSGTGGTMHYFHLASGRKNGGRWLEAIVLQSSSDGGKTWTPGTAIGSHLPKQQDKPWPAIAPANGRMAVAWTEFDRYGSNNPRDKSRILISFSDDNGRSWSRPVRINDTDGDCRDDDNTVEGAVPLFDGKGNVYVVWAYNGKIWFDYSSDGGKTWHQDRAIAKQDAGWAFDIDGIYRCNGLPQFFKDKNENFYLLFADKRDGTGGDIRLLVSKDHGKHWAEQSLPVSSKRDQFFPAATIDTLTNTFQMLYYDRSQTQGNATQVKFLLWPLDGSQAQIVTVNRSPFTPVKFPFFGDYIGMDAYNGLSALIWTEIRNFGTQVHTAVLELKRKTE